MTGDKPTYALVWVSTVVGKLQYVHGLVLETPVEQDVWVGPQKLVILVLARWVHHPTQEIFIIQQVR